MTAPNPNPCKFADHSPALFAYQVEIVLDILKFVVIGRRRRRADIGCARAVRFLSPNLVGFVRIFERSLVEVLAEVVVNPAP